MSSASASKDVFLMADPSVNLSEHVGHQVMVTGRMDRPGVAERVALEQRVEPELERAKGGTFTVTKVSMISATCSTGS